MILGTTTPAGLLAGDILTGANGSHYDGHVVAGDAFEALDSNGDPYIAVPLDDGTTMDLAGWDAEVTVIRRPTITGTTAG